MPVTELVFREEDHTYWMGEQLIPNVTRVLERITDYSRIPRDVLLRAQTEGRHIHKAVELDARNDLDWETLPEWMIGHLEAWRKFQHDTRFEILASEERLFHPRFRYAGTLDLVGPLSTVMSLIDIKRSFYAGPAINLQTAAYADAYRAIHPKAPRIRRRFGLQLRANGTYRLEPFDEEDDIQAFLAYLTCYRWEQKHGYGSTAIRPDRAVGAAADGRRDEEFAAS